MGVIYFQTSEQESCSVEFDPGDTLMQVALAAGIPGIDAACGGNCSCATCHVVVDPGWADKLPPASDDENELLDGTAAARQPHSRLSCQIRLTAELDSLVVSVPEF